MLIKLFRHTFTEESTIGTMVIGQKSWHTIEDKDRGLQQSMGTGQVQDIKVYAKTAIPYGMYRVVITQSQRFTKQKGSPVFTPQLLQVPGFEGIRIHPANYASQLEGCIAPGVSTGTNAVYQSKVAYREILDLINIEIKKGESVWIEILKGSTI